MVQTKKLKSYYLKEYSNFTKGSKTAVLKLTTICSTGLYDDYYIELDEEDINYLSSKYKVSDLKMKEIEQELLLNKLQEIQKELTYLRNTFNE